MPNNINELEVGHKYIELMRRIYLGESHINRSKKLMIIVNWKI